MLPITRLVPKEFLPLGRKPAIQHVAEEVCQAGIKRLVFVISPQKTHLNQLFGEVGNRLPGFEHVELEYVVQERQHGLGHAVLCAAPVVGENPFAVALGDCLIGLPNTTNLLGQLIACRNANSGLAIGFEQIAPENTHRYGIAVADADSDTFTLKGLVEKPAPGTSPSDLAICGRYVLDPSIFEFLQATPTDTHRELQLTHALDTAIRAGTPAVGVRLDPEVKRYDIGNIESYISAFVDFAIDDDALGQIILHASAQKT